MGLIRSTSSNTSNIGRSHLRLGEEILKVKTYRIDPKTLTKDQELIEKHLDNWKKKNDAEYRYVIDVQGALMHVTMIKTKSNVKVRTLKEEQDEIKVKQAEIKEDIKKLKNDKGEEPEPETP